MANVAFYSVQADGTRTVQNKGDWQDLITNLDPDATPFWSVLKHRKVQDQNPKTLADSLSAADTANAHADGAVAPAAVSTARTVVQNWAQNFRKTAAVSNEQVATAQYGLSNEYAYQKAKQGVQILQDIEAVFVSDQARVAPAVANGRTPKADGLSTIISSHTSSTFSQANYETLAAAVWADGGKPDVAYMSSAKLILVSAWTTTPTRFTTKIDELHKEVRLYHDPVMGPVKMIPHHLMPKDVDGTDGAHFAAIQPDLWEICDFVRMTWDELPDLGGGPSGQWRYSGCPLCRAEEGNLCFDA